MGETVRGLYQRNDVKLRELEGMEQGKGWYPLPGKSLPESTVTQIVENGIRYQVDFENGQKTGFFLDQKYNRAAAARIAPGRAVLGLLHPHGLLWAQLRQGRGQAGALGGCQRDGHRLRQRERRPQRPLGGVRGGQRL